ncbi:ribosomal protein S18-alanine N-acetyltransferase [Thalassovita sp.]|uniref:ribosomal protein S18-alanine N-acetyltransferase n=1 Tax=Thalassovita sp. TaxID=1979401 RepID=UPI002881074F|nr:ribosomal protein S18-alanine N-acetyltransferase [Thalassovita sp.]MDF1802883.1 ribosomal protein S18-alanine N-acetyltransferase [Thalassovita sp.]
MTPETLATLHARAFTAQRPWSAAEFASLVDSPLTFLVSAQHTFALGRVIADEAELLTLATDPAQQRQGLGRTILRNYETTAKSRGATRSFLEVAADNHAAIQLYSSAGYTTDGLRPGYYKTPDGRSVDAMLMSRALPLG